MASQWGNESNMVYGISKLMKNEFRPTGTLLYFIPVSW